MLIAFKQLTCIFHFFPVGIQQWELNAMKLLLTMILKKIMVHKYYQKMKCQKMKNNEKTEKQQLGLNMGTKGISSKFKLNPKNLIKIISRRWIICRLYFGYALKLFFFYIRSYKNLREKNLLYVLGHNQIRLRLFCFAMM